MTKYFIGLMALLVLGVGGWMFLNKMPVINPGADTPTNQWPVIGTLTGPTTLSVNQSGTWHMKATDPENDALEYVVRWGDEPPTVDVAYPFNWPVLGLATAYDSPDFTHAYSKAGTYEVVFAVRDIDQDVNHAQTKIITVTVGAQKATSVKWTMGAKIDEYFSTTTVALTLPEGSVKTADVRVGSDCLELNEENLKDAHIIMTNARGEIDKAPNLIKPGVACVARHTFSWFGVFYENGKYYVKQHGDDASGLGRAKWEIVKEII